MGGLCSSYRVDIDPNERIESLQQEFDKTVSVPLEVQLAHYTPPGFPLIPIINKRTTQICRASWERMISSNRTPDHPNAAIIDFYHEFYERLDNLDGSGKFEAVLSRHTGSRNKNSAKGELLIRIVKYILTIEEDSKEVQMSLYMLGKSHSQRAIRPWQYSIFAQALLYTVSSRLGHGATHEVMEAWVNLFAFVLKSMLRYAIRGLVVETEYFINTSSVFHNQQVSEELNEFDAAKRSLDRLPSSASLNSNTITYNSQYSRRSHGNSNNNDETSVSISAGRVYESIAE